MRIKEFIRQTVLTYFILTTLICFSTFVLGTLFAPEARFGYEAFLSPLINAFFGMIPVVVMYSPKEPSPKQLLIRKAIQLISIEGIMFLLLYFSDTTPNEKPIMIGLFVTVFIIYVLAHVIEYLLDSETAKEVNKLLESYQRQGGKV